MEGERRSRYINISKETDTIQIKRYLDKYADK